MSPHATPAARLTPEEAGLLDWFCALTPGQRLAELESRIEFFRSTRTDDNPELPSPHRNPDPARG
jgi:hypothetical protein